MENADDTKPVDVLIASVLQNTAYDIEAKIKQLHPKVLILLSDEFGTYPEYHALFDLVKLGFRQYGHPNYLKKPHVYYLPLGYHCWDARLQPQKIALEYREYLWAYIGSFKNVRLDWLKQLEQKTESQKCIYKESKDILKNHRILQSSKFLFCPRGTSQGVDCFRQYAGCEHGCIPIVQCTHKDWDDFYGKFLIEPPWLHADNVRDLAEKMLELANKPQQLQNLQRENQRWWQSIQSVIRNKIWFA